MNYQAIIIGGGACGLMCAVQAGFLGKKILVLEKNARPGAKILVSGGGRCNYTNLYASPVNFISENPHFCKSALSQWTVADTIAFFESYGITGHEKTLGQLFPVSNKAKDIVDVFVSLCNDLGQGLQCNAEVKSVARENGSFRVSYLVNGMLTEVTAPAVVMASGGLPVSKMGASDFALRIARQFGMRVTETAPALVPLTITGKDADWFAELSGNTIFSRTWNDEIGFEENILFTHWGLSGPAILQQSSYWRPGETLLIDLYPGGEVLALISAEKVVNGKRSLLTLLSQLFTRKFAEALGKFLPVHKNLASLSNADLEKVQQMIHHFTVKPAGDKGYDKAEVMRGGVATGELSSKTLEAKQVPGLFFGGECVDVTGWLGGYNFQWAWASGFVIAQHL
ncbi:NAD(P)/FAD-dependent oxidoreductase [Hufsiella ginkgonis]|uniref:Aminoacetone oxidase family FAD-binding enzyme n=1 Tax=Hufsiella ginkgonis TaxID=2695274 RepID=A0A7K1XWL7_9SPHI|nr:NAD(P)/FAD-dependent oxidoreductase [Hufsiella ginkgonis]MXV15402.1 aminoacetone oxidase family FAD-binding enzyme [Hufsiella ginkgonis]